MCNVLYVSTTAEGDLSQFETGNLFFDPVGEIEDEEVFDFIQHPQKYYVSTYPQSCSCHFRHWIYQESAPEFQSVQVYETAVEIESTLAFYDFAASVVTSGHQLDLLDVWNELHEGEEVKTVMVSLSHVPRESFRFFENHRFVFQP